MEEKQEISNENGTSTRRIWQCDEIRLGHSVSKFSSLVSIPASSPNDVVRMHFGLRGDYRFTYKQLGRSFDLIGGHHNIMFSPQFDMVVENKTPEIDTFGIQFPKNLFIEFTENASEALQRFASHILSGQPVLLSENWGTIDPSIQRVIEQIIHCGYSGDLKKIFLLSKSIELLVLASESYQSASARKDFFIKTKSDKEKIIAVRDLINERVHFPPNFSEISRMVGLNEYKLKRGFKETFGTTVFGYLAEQRLYLAHRYLLDTNKTAAEISFDLGFSTPQHFNNAFKKKFGVTPFSVRK
ncbi:helix-turn-helix domain-containing protein [Flavitalea flava]